MCKRTTDEKKTAELQIQVVFLHRQPDGPRIAAIRQILGRKEAESAGYLT